MASCTYFLLVGKMINIAHECIERQRKLFTAAYSEFERLRDEENACFATEIGAANEIAYFRAESAAHSHDEEIRDLQAEQATARQRRQHLERLTNQKKRTLNSLAKQLFNLKFGA